MTAGLKGEFGASTPKYRWLCVRGGGTKAAMRSISSSGVRVISSTFAPRHRKAAVPVGQHLLGLETLQQATAYEGAQDESVQVGLHLDHGIRIYASGRVEDDTRRTGLRTGLSLSGSTALARHFLKHAIDCADVEVHMPVQAGAEAVDEGDCADVQCCVVCIGRTLAVDLQRLCNAPQKDAQHHAQHRAVALHEVAQSFDARVSSTSLWPASVRRRLRVVRCTRVTLAARSSSAMRWLMAALLTPNRAAAAV